MKNSRVGWRPKPSHSVGFFWSCWKAALGFSRGTSSLQRSCSDTAAAYARDSQGPFGKNCRSACSISRTALNTFLKDREWFVESGVVFECTQVLGFGACSEVEKIGHFRSIISSLGSCGRFSISCEGLFKLLDHSSPEGVLRFSSVNGKEYCHFREGSLYL